MTRPDKIQQPEGQARSVTTEDSNSELPSGACAESPQKSTVSEEKCQQASGSESNSKTSKTPQKFPGADKTQEGGDQRVTPVTPQTSQKKKKTKEKEAKQPPSGACAESPQKSTVSEEKCQQVSGSESSSKTSRTPRKFPSADKTQEGEGAGQRVTPVTPQTSSQKKQASNEKGAKQPPEDLKLPMSKGATAQTQSPKHGTPVKGTGKQTQKSKSKEVATCQSPGPVPVPASPAQKTPSSKKPKGHVDKKDNNSSDRTASKEAAGKSNPDTSGACGATGCSTETKAPQKGKKKKKGKAGKAQETASPVLPIDSSSSDPEEEPERVPSQRKMTGKASKAGETASAALPSDSSSSDPEEEPERVPPQSTFLGSELMKKVERQMDRAARDQKGYERRQRLACPIVSTNVSYLRGTPLATVSRSPVRPMSPNAIHALQKLMPRLHKAVSDYATQETGASPVSVASERLYQSSRRYRKEKKAPADPVPDTRRQPTAPARSSSQPATTGGRRNLPLLNPQSMLSQERKLVPPVGKPTLVTKGDPRLPSKKVATQPSGNASQNPCSSPGNIKQKYANVTPSSHLRSPSCGAISASGDFPTSPRKPAPKIVLNPQFTHCDDDAESSDSPVVSPSSSQGQGNRVYYTIVIEQYDSQYKQVSENPEENVREIPDLTDLNAPRYQTIQEGSLPQHIDTRLQTSVMSVAASATESREGSASSPIPSLKVETNEGLETLEVYESYRTASPSREGSASSPIPSLKVETNEGLETLEVYESYRTASPKEREETAANVEIQQFPSFQNVSIFESTTSSNVPVESTQHTPDESSSRGSVLTGAHSGIVDPKETTDKHRLIKSEVQAMIDSFSLILPTSGLSEEEIKTASGAIEAFKISWELPPNECNVTELDDDNLIDILNDIAFGSELRQNMDLKKMCDFRNPNLLEYRLFKGRNDPHELKDCLKGKLDTECTSAVDAGVSGQESDMKEHSTTFPISDLQGQEKISKEVTTSCQKIQQSHRKQTPLENPVSNPSGVKTEESESVSENLSAAGGSGLMPIRPFLGDSCVRPKETKITKRKSSRDNQSSTRASHTDGVNQKRNTRREPVPLPSTSVLSNPTPLVPQTSSTNRKRKASVQQRETTVPEPVSKQLGDVTASRPKAKPPMALMSEEELTREERNSITVRIMSYFYNNRSLETGQRPPLEEKNVICSGCNLNYRWPHVLHCFHVYCFTCILNMFEPIEKTIRCPKCARLTETDDPYKLLIDYVTLMTMCQVLLSPFGCTQCSTGRNAVKYCSTCKNYICISCHKLHILNPNFSSHAVDTIKKICAKDTGILWPSCHIHDGVPLELLCCKECRVQICNVCKEDHTNHQIVDVKIILEQEHYAWGKRRGQLDEIKDGFTQQIMMLNFARQWNETQQRQLKHALDEACRIYLEYIHEFQRRAYSINERGHSNMASRLSRMTTHLNQYQSDLETFINFTSRYLTQRNPANIVHMYPLIRRQYEHLQSVYNSSPYLWSGLQIRADFNASYPAFDDHMHRTFSAIQVSHRGSLDYLLDNPLIRQRFTPPATTSPLASALNFRHRSDPAGRGLAGVADEVYPNFVRTTISKSLSFGRYGRGDYEFWEPSGILYLDDGTLAICDCRNHRIVVYTDDGQYLRTIGQPDNLPPLLIDGVEADESFYRSYGKLYYPYRIAQCPVTRNIVVVERPPSLDIQIYGINGDFVTCFGHTFIKHPRGITVDDDGQILILESRTMRFLMFTSSGVLVRLAHLIEHLDFPNDIKSKNCRYIFISDNRHHCVKIFNYELEYVSRMGNESLTYYPIGMGFNHMNQLVIADNHNTFNITIFDGEGRLLFGYRSREKHANCFNVSLHPSRHELAVTTKDNQVLIFKYNPNANQAARPPQEGPH